MRDRPGERSGATWTPSRKRETKDDLKQRAMRLFELRKLRVEREKFNGVPETEVPGESRQTAIVPRDSSATRVADGDARQGGSAKRGGPDPSGDLRRSDLSDTQLAVEFWHNIELCQRGLNSANRIARFLAHRACVRRSDGIDSWSVNIGSSSMPFSFSNHVHPRFALF